MRTFEEILGDLFIQLREDSSDPAFWTLPEIKDAVNDSLISIADRLMCFKLDEIIEVKADVRTYKLPSNYISGSLYRVEFDKKLIWPISSAQLDAENRSWREQSASEPWNYIPPGDLCNTDEIMLFPKPDTDGTVYNTATSNDLGVITQVGDDTLAEFNQDEGTIVASTGEVQFKGEETGVVVDIKDPTGNLRVFAAKYPKRRINNDETFPHPVSNNPNKILTHGALAILFSKDGEGKDIAKASYHNKRFEERLMLISTRPKSRRFHRMRSISEVSVGESTLRGLNLGEHYPNYPR